MMSTEEFGSQKVFQTLTNRLRSKSSNVFAKRSHESDAGKRSRRYAESLEKTHTR